MSEENKVVKDAVKVYGFPPNFLQDRKTYWFTVSEVENADTCPSCGRPMNKFKNVTAHAKRCFSIKKIGPIYRLHGYVECKCGMLIADNTKAHKLHVCVGAVPAFEPDLSYVRKLRPPTIDQPPRRNQLKPKPWIRNFVSPFRIDIENVNHNPKPVPRVRNFDLQVNPAVPEPQNIYTISSNSDGILMKEPTLKSGYKNTILISKQALRLPSLKDDKCS